MTTTAEKTALLVGGDLAQRTAALISKQGFTCLGLRRNPPTLQQPGVRWVQADLLNPATLANLPAGITHVLYAVTPDQRNESSYENAYVKGLQNLLDALDTSCLVRVVFVSSTAVYGDSTDWVNETTPTVPSGFNGRVLLQAETLLQQRIGNKGVSLRLSGIYGPQRTQLLQRLAGGAVNLAEQNDQWTNRIHIDDAAGACAHALKLPHTDPVYVVTDDTPLGMGRLYGSLASMLGAGFTPPRACDAAHMGGKRLSNARLKASGYTLKWPDSVSGYRAIIEAGKK